MNANTFRQYYEYHFAENRKLWNRYIMELSKEQFTQGAQYSHGSVRNQVVHLMSVDEAWFSDLRRVNIPESLNLDEVDDRKILRKYWDKVEQGMRDYLSTLRDEMLFEKPIKEGEDKDLILWQILLHVVNHGTDHRAQVLRLLNDMGIKTGPQDYIFYAYENP